ncbi:amino acid ABC transporter substrate-binding protein [Paenibacillus sp. CF384]|uniref:amino acid ABC transporter substrate-binding protein n=1 Tax=Paenibacillus sp. CF384 TaxID=1884382 RepID=UPI000897DE1C|nr:amino acid ABC transporter substrate-binding protein [Paenibacillus sp. CF384]SDW11436.1 amino acid ABC transporter substrate-binding protein, PAAT family [Paenibacillus sp. CF384]
MKKSNLVVAAIALTFSLTLTACGSKANSFDQIKEAGIIKIGTEGTYAPFTYHDKDGKLTGFDVEIAEEVAKRIGVKAEFIETKWDGMFAGLDSKRFDAVFNEVTIKDDRKEKYDFSKDYIASRSVLIVASDNNEIQKLEDLKGKKSAQSLTSNLADLAKSFGAEIVQVDGFNQSIDLIGSKRVDATINDKLSFLDFKKQKPDAPVKVVAEADDVSYSAALFNKGNTELVDAVNKALDDMHSDGSYEAISMKYFGQDVSK